MFQDGTEARVDRETDVTVNTLTRDMPIRILCNFR